MHHAMHHMAHMWSYTIDPAELVVKELTEPAPAEESTNTELTEKQAPVHPTNYR
jgi:hypothetical protein